MPRPSTQVALALFAVLVVAAVGALVLPDMTQRAEFHQASVPGLEVTVDGSPPTRVIVGASYPLAGQGAPAAGWTVHDPMLRIETVPSGLGSVVHVTAYPNGEPQARTLAVPNGVLAVTGSAADQLVVEVRDPTALGAPPAARAVIRAAGANPTVDVVADPPAGGHFRYTLSRFWEVAYDEAGNAVRATVANPLQALDGRLADQRLGTLVRQYGAGNPLLDAAWDGAGSRLRALGQEAEAPATAVQGDPWSPAGLTIAQGSLDLLRLTFDSQGSVLRVRAAGELVQRATGQPDLGLDLFQAVPLEVVGATYRDQLGQVTSASLLSPATLAPLFRAALDPQDNVAVAVPTLGQRFELPGNDVALGTGADGLRVDLTRRSDGAPLLAVRAGGAPLAVDLDASPALAEHGVDLGDATINPTFFTGTVLSALGAAGSPAGVSIADLAGNTLFAAQRTADGLEVTAGERELRAASGAIAVQRSPTGDVAVLVRDGAGAPLAEAAVLRADLGAIQAAGAPVVQLTVHQGGQRTSVMAPPMELYGAAGAWTGFRVFNPVNPAQSLVEYDGDELRVLDAAADVPTLPSAGAPPLPTQGNPLLDDAFTLDAGGQAVTVNRGVSPATVRVADQVIALPMVVTGPATSPTSVEVVNPVDATQVLVAYHENADGTTTVRLPDGSQHTLASGLVRSEGLPLASPQWRLTLSPPGGPAQTVVVNRAEVAALMHGNGVDIGPFVSVLGGLAPDVDFHKTATDGPRILEPADLEAGGKWLSGAGDVAVRVDVPQDQDLYVPVLLWDAAQLPVRGASPSVDLVRGAAANGHVRYEGAIPAAWLRSQPSGTAVTFALAYDLRAAGMAAQSFVDDAGGSGYRFRADHAAPEAPRISAEVDPSAPIKLRVIWTATDDGSGVATYEVQKAVTGGPSESPARWETWLEKAVAPSGQFTGEPGKTYWFRARATDVVGNLGPWSETASASIPLPPPQPAPGSESGQGGSGDFVNDPPTIRLISPTGGEVFTAVPSIEVEWRASDPEDSVQVTVAASDDGGVTWETLTTTPASRYVWDVSRLAGEWRLKVTASDGTLQDADVSGRFSIDNAALATADTIGGPGALQPGGAGPGEGNLPGQGGEGGEAQAGGAGAASSPMLLLVGAGVLIVAAAGVAVWQWKVRRDRGR